MTPEETRGGLTFNQYAVLTQAINALRDDLRENNLQMRRLLDDHETRLRRNETLVLLGFSLTIIAAIVVGAVIVIVARP